MDRSVSNMSASVKAGLNPRPNPRRTTNPNALSHVNFELADLMEPTKVLCKVDGVLNAYKGQVDVTEGDAEVGSDNEMNISKALCSIHVHSPFQPPMYISDDDIMLNPNYENFVEVRRNDVRVTMKDLSQDEAIFIERMKLYEKMKHYTKEGLYPISRKPTSQDKFDSYCNEVKRAEVEEILKSANLTVHVTTEEEDSYDYDYSGSGSGDGEDEEMETVVEVRRKAEAEAAADTEMTDIETVARIGDRSLLAEKLEAEEGDEKEAVTSLISTFQLEANGRVEKVIRIESKKGQPVLLIQFDSAEFRDEVLKSSRRPGAR